MSNLSRAARQPRLPEWLRKSATHFQAVHALKTEIRAPESAYGLRIRALPQLHECFSRGAATFMILGNLCTRGCGFCSVPKGSPHKQEFTLDPDEPANVARMAASLKLRYVVITSVNRDDLRRRRLRGISPKPCAKFAKHFPARALKC